MFSDNDDDDDSSTPCAQPTTLRAIDDFRTPWSSQAIPEQEIRNVILLSVGFWNFSINYYLYFCAFAGVLLLFFREFDFSSRSKHNTKSQQQPFVERFLLLQQTPWHPAGFDRTLLCSLYSARCSSEKELERINIVTLERPQLPAGPRPDQGEQKARNLPSFEKIQSVTRTSARGVRRMDNRKNMELYFDGQLFSSLALVFFLAGSSKI